MIAPDVFTAHYEECLEGIYDCTDRLVLNAYFIMGQSPGGFRTWWRQLMGNDDNLDDTHLMRFAGRFSRRVHAWAGKEGIPLVKCQRGERKHELAKQYIPQLPFQGVFCILVGRAPAPVIEVRGTHIQKKTPQPYVNHYYFHIMDPDWGHVTIRFCPHPPFNAKIILNGHEYVSIEATRQNIDFVKEANCFTHVSDAAGLAGIADTMIRSAADVGRLVQVCERWIYSSCLCFALDLAEQQRTGFRYAYSVYQAEYSRNLLFERGRVLDQIFNNIIDRTRAPLEIRTVKTIFGVKHRPFHKDANGRGPRIEAAVERPVYNLTVFKVHLGKLTVKIYSKGERVLRIEAVAHNARELRCGIIIDRLPRIIESLKGMLDRFMSVLNGVDVSFIDAGAMETWHLPSQVGTSRIGGIDINQSRMRAVMEAVITLSLKPRGFTVSELAAQVREIIPDIGYQPRQAAYDLRKLTGKDLVRHLPRSRRYESTSHGLRSMVALITLRDKVLLPLLANAGKRKAGPKLPNRSPIDIHYDNIQIEMQKVFQCLHIAA